MLPLDVYGFAGRSAQLAQLDAILHSGADQPSAVVITTLSGTAGIGKTALAVHWAHRVRDRYPDGQLYLNLRGFDPAGSAVHPAQAVRTFLDALGVPADRIPADHDAQVGLYRSELANRRILVVLDNARDAAQVRPLLPGSPTTTVLITSRNQLASLVVAEGAHPLTMDLLSPAESRELLTRRLGHERVAREPAAVRGIIASCARLPLALAIAAARAAIDPELPLAALAADLAAARGTLDALTGEDPTTDARAVFSWSYRALSAPAARLFWQLGLHPGPDSSLAAAASLAGLPSARVRATIAELSSTHLITEHRPGRYAMHDLLRAYAAEQVEDRTAAIRRLLDHYLRTAEGAATLVNPLRERLELPPPDPDVTVEALADPAGALAWFGAERAGLVAAVALAGRARLDTYAWQLARSLITYLDGQGHWLDALACQRIAIEAATRLGDQQALARAHRLLALTHLRLGQYDNASAEVGRALELSVALGDVLGQARCEDLLSTTYNRQGNHVDALTHARRALALYTQAGHAAGQAVVLNSIGWLHAHLGNHELALSHCEQALELQREIDDQAGAADTLDSIGYAHHCLGRYAQAIGAYEAALALYGEIGDRNLAAETLIRLGDSQEASGDLTAASRTWHRAAAIFDELDRPDQQLRDRLDRLDVPPPRSNGETTWAPQDMP
jgi:tetratricopeptide (TPR) repeat protein